MPRVHDRYADCVVYIYPCLSDAKSGVRMGGSGFLTQVQLPHNPEWSEAYLVTNRHVIRKTKTPVVRINRTDDTVEYFQTTQEQWILHPDGDDVAVFPFRPIIAVEELKITAIPLRQFLTPALISKEDVGIGDDAFMIGRFINHEGKQQNVPAIRFGNIAMMAKETIVSDEGLAQESFLVEIRSLPGYSGSPVFLYSVNPMMDFSQRNLTDEEELLRKREREKLAAVGIQTIALDPGPLAHISAKGPYLLGIDWCHLHTTERVRDKNGELLSDVWTVRTNSGMAGVIPAWKIAELLNSEERVEMRRIEDEKLTQERAGSGVSLETADQDHPLG